MADQDKEVGIPVEPGQTQPGQVISPENNQPPVPVTPAEPQPAPPETPAPDVTPLPATPQPEESSSTDEPEADTQTDADEVRWTASEYVDHEKSAGWYLSLATAAIVLAAAVYLATKDLVSCVVVIVCAVIFGVYGSHKPRELEYHLSETGFSIGQREYVYDQFRSFSVVPEGVFLSVVFMPLKRFSPPITIYFDPKNQDVILSILSDRLPFEEHQQDAVDSLLRRIRF